jgi:hypothetical protein
MEVKWSALLPGQELSLYLDRGLGGTQIHSGRGGKEKNSKPLPGTELRSPRSLSSDISIIKEFFLGIWCLRILLTLFRYVSLYVLISFRLGLR